MQAVSNPKAAEITDDHVVTEHVDLLFELPVRKKLGKKLKQFAAFSDDKSEEARRRCKTMGPSTQKEHPSISRTTICMFPYKKSMKRSFY